MSLADIYEKIRPAVVAIAIWDEPHYRIFGSGFCVDPEGIIVTARHVITAYYEIRLKASLPKIGAVGKIDIKEPDFNIVFFRKESSSWGPACALPIGFVFPCEGTAS